MTSVDTLSRNGTVERLSGARLPNADRAPVLHVVIAVPTNPPPVNVVRRSG